MVDIRGTKLTAPIAPAPIGCCRQKVHSLGKPGGHMPGAVSLFTIAAEAVAVPAACIVKGKRM